MGGVRVQEMLLLLGMMMFCPVDSRDRAGCEECALQEHPFLPVYQCMGCCFSTAFPTPHSRLRSMVQPKLITSNASCCVADSSYEVEMKLANGPLKVKNHTSCHCSTCKNHKYEPI